MTEKIAWGNNINILLKWVDKTEELQGLGLAVVYTKTPLCAQHYGNAGWLNKIQQEHGDEPIQMLYIYILGFRFLKDIFHYTYQIFVYFVMWT